MEHVEDDFAFLERIHKLTRPGGQIIISVPAHQKYWTVHDDVAGHIRRYDRKRLKKLFDNKRFSDVEVISYGFPFINILWLFRRMHGKSQQKQKQTWSKEKQTKNSGVGGLSSIFQLLAIISNKYVFYIPNLIASLFNKHDWSEGYIITATKK